MIIWEVVNFFSKTCHKCGVLLIFAFTSISFAKVKEVNIHTYIKTCAQLETPKRLLVDSMSYSRIS